MTDDTGPRTSDSGVDQTWSHPHSPEEGRPEAAQQQADPPSADQADRQDEPAPAQQQDEPRTWHGDEAPVPPQPEPGYAQPPQASHNAFQAPQNAPRSAPQSGPWAQPPNAPMAGTGQWPPQNPGAPAPNPPHLAAQGGAPGMNAPAAGGPGTPPPGGPGFPAGPAGPGGGGPYGTPGFPQPQPHPPKRSRSMPLWAVLIVVAVVAVGSAGAGGVLGGSLGVQQGAPPEQTSSPKLNTDLPSDAPSRAPDTVAGVAQRVSPSVVSIQDGGTTMSGNGSGFVIENDHVVTNNHVASALESGEMEVAYSNGKTSGAGIVGTEPDSDLAVLRLEDPLDVQPLEFGDSDDVTVGDEVVAIGAPLGLAGTVTSGIISAVDRPVRLGEDSPGQGTAISALQTDAAINPGNSGGPLVDAQGRVIGVNTAIATMGGSAGQQSGSIGLGFAIPSAEVEGIVDDILSGAGEDGSGSEDGQAQIGVVLDDSYDQGARVASDQEAGGDAVEPDGPADQAGLQPGDVIVRFDGRDISDADTLIRLIGEYDSGDRVEVVFERGGERNTTDITLGSSTD